MRISLPTRLFSLIGMLLVALAPLAAKAAPPGQSRVAVATLNGIGVGQVVVSVDRATGEICAEITISGVPEVTYAWIERESMLRGETVIYPIYTPRTPATGSEFFSQSCYLPWPRSQPHVNELMNQPERYVVIVLAAGHDEPVLLGRLRKR